MRYNTQNLYIDESGSGAIYEPPPKNYQFFNMAGVLLSEKSERLIADRIQKWKNQYLVKKSSTLHAVDLFEDFKKDYRTKKINDNTNFYVAINELVEIFLSVKYEARVFYIDLFELRKELKFEQFIKSNTLKDHINREYKKKYLQPVSTILSKFFIFHEENIQKTKKFGSICFESQKELDEQTIKTFHATLIKHSNGVSTYKYGEKILGINFYTKASLCSAIELADFIAYGSTQYLRYTSLSPELTIQKERFKILMRAYKRIKSERKIQLRNCTTDCIDTLKSFRKQKKAS